MRTPEVIDRRTVYAGEINSVRADRDAAGLHDQLVRGDGHVGLDG
jgi:hypothetical protein